MVPLLGQPPLPQLGLVAHQVPPGLPGLTACSAGGAAHTPAHAGHHIGEFLPSLHNTLCKFLGRCGAAGVQGLHLFELFPHDDTFLHGWPAWMNDATRCFAPQPKTHINHPSIRGGVVLVRRAVVGIGPDCRAHPWCNGPE